MTVRIGTGPLARVFSRLPGRDHDPRFQHALEQLPGAAFLITRREGAVLAVNSRATALTEWTRDELMAHTFAELAAPGAAGATLDPVYTIEPGRVLTLTAVPVPRAPGA
jgi:PAS domain-containing protein